METTHLELTHEIAKVLIRCLLGADQEACPRREVRKVEEDVERTDKDATMLNNNSKRMAVM